MPGRVLVDGLPGETRAAVLDADDGLIDLLIRRADRPEVAGNSYFGRVEHVDRGLAAAFVEIGLERPGFLPLKAVATRPNAGDALAVRVTREPSPGKGAKLTAQDVPAPDDPGRPPRLLAQADPLAALIRAADPERVEVESAERRRALARALPEIAERIAGHTGPEPLFDTAGLNAHIAALLQPEVPLPGGGRLRIEPVQTLTAVDVDAAGHAGAGPARTALEVDLAAAPEIVRQVRLRALSGLIVVDFLELDTKDARRQVAAALQRAFAAAGLDADVAPMRASGLVEIARPRRRRPLHELLAEPAGWTPDAVTVALDLLRQAGREAAAEPGRELTLVAAPAVIAALQDAARPAFDELARRLGAAPELRADPSRPRESPEILLA